MRGPLPKNRSALRVSFSALSQVGEGERHETKTVRGIADRLCASDVFALARQRCFEGDVHLSGVNSGRQPV
jgi:hypothetical protein